jgi:hypothetical protein
MSYFNHYSGFLPAQECLQEIKKGIPFSEVLFSEAILAFRKVHNDDSPEEMSLQKVSRGKAGVCFPFN